MHLCKPCRSGIQAIFLIVFTAAFVLISALMAGLYPLYAKWFGAAAGAFTVIGATFLYRYTLCEFVYCLDGDILSVKRTVGFSTRTVFSLKLDKTVKLSLSKKDCKKAKGLSCRQNLTASTAFLIYTDAGKQRYMEFEPNHEFYAIVKDALEE